MTLAEIRPDGSVKESLGSGGGSGSELDYAQRTADLTVSATTEATSVAVVTGSSITYDGTKVRIEFFCNQIVNSVWSQTASIVFYRDAVVLGRSDFVVAGASPSQTNIPLNLVFYDTPSAGAHVYAVKAFVLGGGGNITFKAGVGGSGNYIPVFMRITKA